ncbi:MAG: AAA family ATPase [Candidatus Hodarchaeales archaeon]|jgi:dephospho-CoA kinase
MRLLIGITGNMGSGKSLAADYFTKKHHCKKLRLSGKMREIAKELEIEPTRDFLQGIGKFMRDFDDDVWVRYIYNKVRSNKSPIVIDDIRRKNEITFLQPLGFKFIRIDAESEIRRRRIESRGEGKITETDWYRWSTHLTENQVKQLKVDFQISNNGTFEELYKELDNIIAEIQNM